jgi:hypothetical protein|eukprot:CAMPEP_0169070622 /NCGR_PEP_ID=MMETSP1015-20121227/5212_1 /TAXON_ID=342587 /ORGANISM="Karlodinium micrum, Strain CCMP2283" /LENGTH=241 /DNA_ID=CAMNT_0009129629 /DNA_START=58 /DNA_END=783 /DNA_ORIENTATION=+
MPIRDDEFYVKRSWYSQTFHNSEEHDGDAVNAFLRQSFFEEAPDDAGSDVSTDVGEEEEFRKDSMGFEIDCARSPHARLLHERPSFLKISRKQRIDQLARVVDEFKALDFDSVDVSSQESLVMRKLILLKSLGDSTSYHNKHGRSEEPKLILLGLNGARDTFENIASQAQLLCESRQFRSAFNVLQAAVSCINREVPHQMSAEEVEAMALRRLRKRQRQREERREQRRSDRKNRSAHQWKA